MSIELKRKRLQIAERLYQAINLFDEIESDFEEHYISWQTASAARANGLKAARYQSKYARYQRIRNEIRRIAGLYASNP